MFLSEKMYRTLFIVCHHLCKMRKRYIHVYYLGIKYVQKDIEKTGSAVDHGRDHWAPGAQILHSTLVLLKF